MMTGRMDGCELGRGAEEAILSAVAILHRVENIILVVVELN